MIGQDQTSIDLREKGLCRIWDIVRDRKRGWTGIAPFGRSHFLDLVKAGKAPQPIRLSHRLTCWRIEEIREWLESLQKGVK